MVTSEQLAQAKEAGGWAREAGRPIDACPTFCNGPIGQPQRDAWRAGWAYTDSQMKRGR